MYQLTIFEGKEICSISLHDEYPPEIDLGPGQWIDICRLTLSEAMILEHLIEEPNIA